MAVVALVAGWQVVCWFTTRLAAVMATDASAQHLQVIDPCHRDPGASAVAGFAPVGRRHVYCGLRGGSNMACLAMATNTLRRRTFKHAVRMA